MLHHTDLCCRFCTTDSTRAHKYLTTTSPARSAKGDLRCVRAQFLLKFNIIYSVTNLASYKILNSSDITQGGELQKVVVTECSALGAMPPSQYILNPSKQVRAKHSEHDISSSAHVAGVDCAVSARAQTQVREELIMMLICLVIF